MARTGEREMGGRPEKRSRDATVKLADLGVTKTQSSRWQKLSELDDDTFEERASTAKKHAVASVELTSKERTAEKQAADEGAPR